MSFNVMYCWWWCTYWSSICCYGRITTLKRVYFKLFVDLSLHLIRMCLQEVEYQLIQFGLEHQLVLLKILKNNKPQKFNLKVVSKLELHKIDLWINNSIFSSKIFKIILKNWEIFNPNYIEFPIYKIFCLVLFQI